MRSMICYKDSYLNFIIQKIIFNDFKNCNVLKNTKILNKIEKWSGIFANCLKFGENKIKKMYQKLTTRSFE